MLEVGRNKIKKKKLENKLEFVQGDSGKKKSRLKQYGMLLD